MRRAKDSNLLRSILFLLILSLILGALSKLSIILDRNANPLFNYAARDLLDEPKNSIDVLTIGTSDVYSGVCPLLWWNSYGYTGYAWGEPAQRIFETHEYLKKIYQVQTPKVVFLEIGNLYRDKSDAQNLDSMAKAYIADVFPLVTYHRTLANLNLANLEAKPGSVTKGYLIRRGTVCVSGSPDDYMEPDPQSAPINAFSREELSACIDLCREHGSTVILLSIPSFTDWNMEKHNAVADLAQKEQVPYLDLNLDLKGQINWETDTADGGKHLNYKGAEKVTAYLGQYLSKNNPLPDHRQDLKYGTWNTDYQDCAAALQALS